MKISRVINSFFRSCSYVINRDGTSWVVDCGDVALLLPLIDGELRGVFLTHAHYDHIYGLNTLLEMFPAMLIYTNEAGKVELLNDKRNFSRYISDPFILQEPEKVVLVEDGHGIDLYEGCQAIPIFTPGHSPSCVTWVIRNAVFTGDSYIPGVKTVTNFPLSDRAQAAASELVIRDLIAHREVYPGHAPES